MKFSTLLLSLFLCLESWPLMAQNRMLTQKEYDAKMAWWREAKFGLFMHWGPYTLYGGVYNGYKQRRADPAWIMNRCKIPFLEYRAKATTFNPVGFDADKIVRAAKEAGMKYVVFTTKHHDGFAMFKSNASRFNIVDYTDFKRDVVDEIVRACRKYDMKIGFYYSQSQDWCNPGGAVARKEMWEGWDNPDSTFINAYTKAHAGHWDYFQTTSTFDEYFHRVALPQVKELLERYPDVSLLWFDTPMGITDKQASEMQDLLSQYPNLIVNDRLKRPNFLGDYKTPEGKIPSRDEVVGVDWESCMNLSNTWSYRSWDRRWKDSKEIIRNMITIAARGGNYLLNIWPDASGVVYPEAYKCLAEVGAWMNEYGEMIYGSQRSDVSPNWGECIRKDINGKSILYLCVFDMPTDGKLVLNGQYRVSRVLSVTNEKLKFRVGQKELFIDVSSLAVTEPATIIKVELKNQLPAIKLVRNSQKMFDIDDVEN